MGFRERAELSILEFTFPETNMETQKGPYKDYSPFKKVAIWVSMLICGSVGFSDFSKPHEVRVQQLTLTD